MVGDVSPASVQLSLCIPELLVVHGPVRLHGLLALLPAPGQQALNGVQVAGLGRRQLGRLVMGSPAFLREVAPLMLMLLWRGGWRLGTAGLRHHRLQRRLLRWQLLRLLGRLVLGQLVRLEMVKRLSNSRIDSVLETRRWLRRLRREVLRLAGGMLHD